MKSSSNNQALLPSGFVDLLPPEAEREAHAVAALMEVFSCFGYARVKPPLLEFEESLFAPGPGAKLAGESFRVMDPVSHRMMGLRSDTTAQIARMAASRLQDEPRPLRLAYANDVLRTKASQQRIQRQFMQVGCELVGDENIYADIEACVMALSGLRALGLEAVTLDLCIPRLVGRILRRFGLGEADEQHLRSMLDHRDMDGIKDFPDPELSKILLTLLKSCYAGEEAFEILKGLDLEPEEQRDIIRLRGVYEGVQEALGDLGFTQVSLSLDLVENKGFEYHCGIGFTLFSAGVSGELGRGGRYDIDFAGQDNKESAVGFTLYMDVLQKIMPQKKGRDIVFVSHEEKWSVISALHKEGYIVLRGMEHAEKPLRCTHIYKDGKIQKI